MTSPTPPLPPPSFLSDPTLAPFLSETFSAKTYLNDTLPPLLPPSSLKISGTPSSSSKSGTEPLSALSSKATTLLSTLDLQTQRLLSTLQSLTDEILRLTPRLGYEVDVLRSDVLSLSTTLTGVGSGGADDDHLAAHIQGFTDDAKPEVLAKLEMLSTVRARMEDVVRVFGNAMDWPLTTSDPPSPTMPPVADVDVDVARERALSRPRTPSPIRALEESHKKTPKKAGGSGTHPIEDVLYLLSCGDLPAARAKVGELRELCKVFENTVEGPARSAVVEALEARIDEEEEKMKKKRKSQEHASRGGAVAGDIDERGGAEEEKSEASGWSGGRDGYYGLINQLSRMRGNMG